MHGHTNAENVFIDAAVGKDTSVLDIHKMCTANRVECSNPRPARTVLVSLEHGYYNGHPASKVLLKPVTGIAGFYSVVWFRQLSFSVYMYSAIGTG